MGWLCPYYQYYSYLCCSYDYHPYHHSLSLFIIGRYSHRLYIAYTTFYILGSILAMQVPFVGFNVVKQAECIISHGVFIFLQCILYSFLFI